MAAAGDPDAQPVLSGLHAVAAQSVNAEPVYRARDGRDGASARLCQPRPAATCSTGRRWSTSVHPRIRRGLWPTAAYWRDAASPWPNGTISGAGRRMLFRDLARRGPCGRVTGRGRDGGRPRAAVRVPFAVQAVEPAGPAVRLRRGRAEGHRPRSVSLRAIMPARPCRCRSSAWPRRSGRTKAHVDENRALYQQKYLAADQILGNVPGYVPPPAGFFLWLPVQDGEHRRA
jgi:N-succinyldiaminopimelate aminotransferase